MGNDIVPELLELIEKEFDEKVLDSDQVKNAIKLLQEKKANYKDANEFAIEIGEILSEVLGKNIIVETLPDGKMYYNIADRILNTTLSKNHELISSYSADVQTQLNRNAGLKIKEQKPKLNQSRIDGIVERVSNEDDFNKIKWILDEPIKNFSQAIVDDTAKANMDFHAKSGLRPKITRHVVGNCCDWCRKIAGTYDYGDEPEDIYRRHRYCRCRVEYDPKDGRGIQDAHTKEWKDPERDAKIEVRKKIGIEEKLTIKDKQFGKKASKLMEDYGLNVTSKSDRIKFEKIILDISDNPDYTVRVISWRGQKDLVTAYIKGNDVVLVNNKNEYITILKGGANNARIKNQGRT